MNLEILSLVSNYKFQLGSIKYDATEGKGIDSCYSALLYLRSSYNTNSLTWTIGGESVQVSKLVSHGTHSHEINFGLNCLADISLGRGKGN